MKNKYAFSTIYLIIFNLFILITINNNISLAEPSWQEADGAIVELGIRDKYGDLGKYTATFIINAPDGKQHKVIKNVVGSDWGEAVFPKDFGSVYLQNGNYTYKKMVGNKVVGTGSFQYHNRSIKMLSP
jgi:hypothetical protein